MLLNIRRCRWLRPHPSPPCALRARAAAPRSQRAVERRRQPGQRRRRHRWRRTIPAARRAPIPRTRRLGLDRTPLDGDAQRHGWNLTKTGAFSAERLPAGSWTQRKRTREGDVRHGRRPASIAHALAYTGPTRNRRSRHRPGALEPGCHAVCVRVRPRRTHRDFIEQRRSWHFARRQPRGKCGTPPRTRAAPRRHPHPARAHAAHP